MNGWGQNGWTGGQYSLWRVLLGLGVLSLAVRQLATAGGDPVSVVITLAALTLSTAVIVGWWDSPAAALLATVTAGLIVQDSGLSPRLWPLVAMLLLHAVAPPAPFGSRMARGRVNPDGDWQLPVWLHAASWFVLLAATVLAVFDTGPDDTVWTELANRGGVVTATILAASPRTRRLAWLIAGLTWVGLACGGMADWWLSGLAPAWLLSADPAWIPDGRHRDNRSGPAWLFYDGHCGLCHRCVRLVLSEDRREDTIRLAPLQGAAFSEMVESSVRERLPDSIVLVTPAGEVLCRSAAVLELGRLLGGCWRMAAGISRVIPRPLADLVYRLVATIRHRLFGRPTEACPLIPDELRGRFDLRYDE